MLTDLIGFIAIICLILKQLEEIDWNARIGSNADPAIEEEISHTHMTLANC